MDLLEQEKHFSHELSLLAAARMVVQYVRFDYVKLDRL